MLQPGFNYLHISLNDFLRGSFSITAYLIFFKEPCMCAKTKKPSVKAVVSNLSKPMPLAKKLSLLIKNNTVKLVNLQNCCGHPGEPGC